MATIDSAEAVAIKSDHDALGLVIKDKKGGGGDVKAEVRMRHC